MARRKRKEIKFDIRPAVEFLGLDLAIEQIGKKEVIEQIGKKEIIEQIGKKEVVAELELEDILAGLPSAKRRELKRRLEAEFGKS